MHARQQQLSEREICTKYITPGLQSAGWDIDKQIFDVVSSNFCLMSNPRYFDLQTPCGLKAW